MSEQATRRDFLKQSVAIATGALILPQLIPSTALGMGGKLPPSDRIIVGAIGTGQRGMANLRDFLGRLNVVQYVSVCDVDTNHAGRAKEMIDKANQNSDCRVYGDYRELLDREYLDAVVITVPDHWHGLVYIAASDKKLDVYAEKPLARTIHDSRAIVNAVKRNNVVWQTGSWQRSRPIFHHAAELVINGRIGKISRIEVGLPDGGQGIGTPPPMEVPAGLNWEMWLGPAPKVPFRGVCHWHWRWILDYSGGQLTDWAGHHIDIAQWGIGMERSGPIEISGEAVYPRDGIYNTPIEYDFLCRYANGIEMRVANSSRLPHGGGTTWYGDKGWISVDRGRLDASFPQILKEVIRENEIHLYKSEDHVENFLECIKSGRETVAPVEIAHRSISAGLLGEIAMTTGQKIKWDPVKEEIIGNLVASRLLTRPYRHPWKLPSI